MGGKRIDKLSAKELSRAAFEDGLNTLRSGHIPGNMEIMQSHVNDTVKELIGFMKAVTECALRQNAQIELMQSIIEAGKKAGMIGKRGGG